MTKLLEMHGMDAFYGATQVIFGLDLSLDRGGITAILGANGAGKTTTLRAICRSVKTSGEIRLDGESIAGRSTEDVVRKGVAHVPDGRGTFTQLSVEDNLRLGAYTQRDKAQVVADIDNVYQRFPRLKERRQQQAGTLSGGEQQMLAISRALMLRPRLLLLDEPSFGVAPKLVAEIFDVLSEIHATDKISILLVEQNANLALEFSDDAYLLETGRVVMEGDSKTMAENEVIRKSYLGY